MRWRERSRKGWMSWLRRSNPEQTRYPNCSMHIAARPPENAYFQKDHGTLEKRSGR
jgi:hypothetical protein